MGKRFRFTCCLNIIVLYVGAVIVLPRVAAADTSLNVTDFGAKGDAFDTLADTVANSAVIHLLPTNQLSAADAGKVALVFGVGAASSPTNQQDLVARIVSVDRRTNITLSVPATISATGVRVICGTENAASFQQCVNACTDTNTVVQIPSGHYLIVPPGILNPNFVMDGTSNPGAAAAVVVRSGGIHFLGTDPVSTVLLGCGAWMLKGGSVYRGWMFECLGPVANSTAPLIFENLTLDGGVQQGRQAFYNGGPARTNDGAGWDITHDAVVDAGPPPLHAFKQFANCTFTHWRGEMVKSVTSMMDGYIEVTNCSFLDGEASGFNFTFTHRITGCTFSNLDMAMEFYTGYMTGPSVFENSTVTNVHNAIVLVGAQTNHEVPSYTISGNTLAPSGVGILISPARNVTIVSNSFFGGTIGVGSDDYAYQGSGPNSNIVLSANSFLGAGIAFNVAGGPMDPMVNVTITSNQIWNCGRIADGYGWSTNVVFIGNRSTAGRPGFLHNAQLLGQWFLDDASNDFPWYPLYDNPPAPDAITYANGMRQQLYPSGSNTVFVMAEPHPEKIPPGAAMLVSNAGKFPCFLLSDTNGVQPMPIAVGTLFTFQWQNGVWELGTNSQRLSAPQNLRILN